MGYEHRELDLNEAQRKIADVPNYLLRMVPHVDGTVRICELVRFYMRDATVRKTWTGRAAIELHPHALALIADLPVRKVVCASHIFADLTFDIGEAEFDYLASPHG